MTSEAPPTRGEWEGKRKACYLAVGFDLILPDWSGYVDAPLRCKYFRFPHTHKDSRGMVLEQLHAVLRIQRDDFTKSVHGGTYNGASVNVCAFSLNDREYDIPAEERAERRLIRWCYVADETRGSIYLWNYFKRINVANASFSDSVADHANWIQYKPSIMVL